MRLSEAFAKEGDTVKAVKILNMSLEKMPIKDFDHYSLSIGYPESFYALKETKKARETTATLINLFTEKLVWLSTFSKEDTELIFDDIDTTLYMYRNVVSQAEKGETDKEYLTDLHDKFLNTVKLFNHLIPDEEN
jgi:hypothetical protein